VADIFTDELQAALGAPGCPVCRVVADSVRRWMDSFSREGRNDRATRGAFFAAGGFCQQHGLLFETVGQSSRGDTAVADVYRWLADRDIELLAATRSQLARPHRRLRLRLDRHGRCPGCEESDAATQRKLSFLVEALRGSATRERYTSSDGLCVPHLFEAARRTASEQPELSRFLLDDGQRRLTELCAQLDEFDRKRDHRFRHEAKGPEQRAPSDAIRRYLGGVPIVNQA